MKYRLEESAAFSVLISVYHKEKPKFLKAALISIWDKQILKPQEIVLVKDGPLTKELDQIVEDFKKNSPLKVVSLEQNVGLGKALSIGLEYCKCDVIARMDSDDISNPVRFKKQFDFLLNNPNISIVGSYISEFKGDTSNIIGYRKVPLDSDKIRRFAKFRSPFNHPTVMFKKRDILDVGGYLSLLFLEDYYLWVRALASGIYAANIPESLVFFRMSDDVIGRRHGLFYMKQELQLANYMYKMRILNNMTYFIFVVFRAIPRILPKAFLKSIYKLMRRV